MRYKSHLQACEKAFEKAECRYLSGTHVGRHEGCKLADMIDVPDAQMRRLGRWDHSRMVQHYSMGLPRTGARHLAGHGLKDGTVPQLTREGMLTLLIEQAIIFLRENVSHRRRSFKGRSFQSLRKLRR